MAVHTGMELKMRPGNMAAEPYQAANQKQWVKYPPPHTFIGFISQETAPEHFFIG